MVRGFFDDAAFGVGERMRDDEGVGVCVFGDGFDAADLKACDDAVEDVLFGVREAAAAFVDGDAAV